MPLVTISISDSFSPAEKQTVADSVHDALVGVGFSESDRFQKILRFSKDQFIYDRHYPDLDESRSNRFVLVEIVMPKGRSREFKDDLLMIIVENLRERTGVKPNDVMVVFMETDQENWAYRGDARFRSEMTGVSKCNAPKFEPPSKPFLVNFQE